MNTAMSVRVGAKFWACGANGIVNGRIAITEVEYFRSPVDGAWSVHVSYDYTGAHANDGNGGKVTETVCHFGSMAHLLTPMTKTEWEAAEQAEKVWGMDIYSHLRDAVTKIQGAQYSPPNRKWIDGWDLLHDDLSRCIVHLQDELIEQAESTDDDGGVGALKDTVGHWYDTVEDFEAEFSNRVNPVWAAANNLPGWKL